MSPPNFGVVKTPNGLRVAVNPNPVEIKVRRGDLGAILEMSGCGMTLCCSLTDEARQHLVDLLLAPAGGTHKKVA